MDSEQVMDAKTDKEAHVAGLIQEALEAGLLGAKWASGKGCRWLAEAYNGIGPEWAGAHVRDLVTGKLALFEPAALIHDMRVYESDGTAAAFHYANGEFLLNCLTLAKQSYPWWRPRRYAAIAAANAMFDAVEGPGGWKAWREAHERNLNHKTSDVGRQTSKSGV